MIGNSLKNFPWIVLNITPRTLCHPRWISRQNHTIHQWVLNRTLDSDWMVFNKVQVRCDCEAVHKSTVNLWFQKSIRNVEDLGKDCKLSNMSLRKSVDVVHQHLGLCVVSGTRLHICSSLWVKVLKVAWQYSCESVNRELPFCVDCKIYLPNYMYNWHFFKKTENVWKQKISSLQ